jgi:4-amino-4-deoxy-L-arabinose transferase
MPLQDKKLWFIVIAITLLLAFLFQGTRGLWEPDEGRYVRCAYEMVKSGDWLTPRLNGNPHFSKPPLAYWLIASGLTLFGLNEWGARFFHAIAFILTACMTGYLAAKIWGNTTGLLALLVYVTMVLPFTGANIATTDMILTCFESGAMLAFWLCTEKKHTALHDALWGALMGLFLGLAFLTKGPPGLLPLLVGIAYLALSLQKKKLSYPVMLIGCIVFAAVALPWYFLVIRKYNGLLSYFIKDEIIGRIVTGEHSRNSGPFGAFAIYPHTLLLGALPWSFFWFKWGWETRAAIVTKSWWRQLRCRDNALFIAVWFLLPLLFFTVSSSRLPLYVLPLFVPLALASARSFVLYYPRESTSLVFFRGKPAAYIMIFILLLLGSRAIAANLSLKIDSRCIWQRVSPVIQARVADGRYELAVVDLNHEGLAFYSHRMIENLDIEHTNSHSFALKKSFSQKCDELRKSNFTQVFLLSSKRVKKVTSELAKRGISYSVEQGPFDYALIFCGQTAAHHSGFGKPASPLYKNTAGIAPAVLVH